MITWTKLTIVKVSGVLYPLPMDKKKKPTQIDLRIEVGNAVDASLRNVEWVGSKRIWGKLTLGDAELAIDLDQLETGLKIAKSCAGFNHIKEEPADE